MVDARMIRHSGVGRMLCQILPRLINQSPELCWRILFPTSARSWIEKHIPHAGILISDTPIYSIREQLQLARLIHQTRPALFWSPHYNIPLVGPVRLLTTVHDLCPLALPQFFQGQVKQAYAKFMFSSVARKSNHIAFISEFTQNEFKKHTSTQSPTSVIPNGVDPFWFEPISCVPPVNPFFLYAGNLKPHKNPGLLIKAFIQASGLIPHDLIFVGKGKDSFKKHVRSLIPNHMSQRVRFVGEVDDSELRRLYRTATALVFPSLYEGFGLPALEALAAGCPVLASDIPALREVCGEQALYFDPYNDRELANLMENQRLQPEFSPAEHVEHARRYSWDIAILCYRDLILKLAQEAH